MNRNKASEKFSHIHRRESATKFGVILLQNLTLIDTDWCSHPMIILSQKTHFLSLIWSTKLLSLTYIVDTDASVAMMPGVLRVEETQDSHTKGFIHHLASG